MSDTNPVEELVGKFGGIRPTMAALGEESPNIIQHWIKAKRIPHYRRPQVVDGAERRNVALPDELLSRVFGRRTDAA